MTTITIDLPEPLAAWYFNLSRKSGRTLSDLIMRDLEAVHERRRFRANEYERL